jgi:DNA-binding NarL/FixJ family response regulator
MKELKILVADDHELLRRGVQEVLHSQRGWRVVAHAVNGREAVEKAIVFKPHVAVIDISMPQLDGFEVTRLIRTQIPKTKVVVLTSYESDQIVQRALDAGAHGFILKSDLADCLVKAVKSVSQGNLFLTPKVSEIVLEGLLKPGGQFPQSDPGRARITPRESEIVRLLAQGKTNKEIATLLGITVRTVETHRSKIMLKLGLHSVVELIHYAVRNGIITERGG